MPQLERSRGGTSGCEAMMRLPQRLRTTTVAVHPQTRALRVRKCDVQLLRVRTLQQLISSNAKHTNAKHTNAESRSPRRHDRTRWSSRRSRGLGAPLHAAEC